MHTYLSYLAPPPKYRLFDVIKIVTRICTLRQNLLPSLHPYFIIFHYHTRPPPFLDIQFIKKSHFLLTSINNLKHLQLSMAMKAILHAIVPNQIRYVDSPTESQMTSKRLRMLSILTRIMANS